MKKIILIALIAFMGSCTVTKVTKYTSIPLEKYEITTNLSKEENYDMINTWFVKMSTSRPEYIIQYTNKDSGIISGEFTHSLKLQDPNFPNHYENIGESKNFFVIKCDNNKIELRLETLSIPKNGIKEYDKFEKYLIEDITEYSLSF